MRAEERQTLYVHDLMFPEFLGVCWDPGGRGRSRHKWVLCP